VGRHEFKELEKADIWGTAHTHILWEVLMWKYKTVNMEINITCTVNCDYGIPAKLRVCTVEKLSASGT
jgi:hypothetical protein